MYIYGTFGVPQSVIDFILKYSDKFEPHKGSDLLIIFVAIFFINNRFFKNKRTSFELFTLFSFLYFPFFGYKSRVLLLLLLFSWLQNIFTLEKNLRVAIKETSLFFLGFVILFQSVFLINGSSFLKFNQAQEEVKP